MKILRINMKNHVIQSERFWQKEYGYLGGRGLIAKVLTDEFPPKSDPLGPDNPLIFCTTFFSGTILPSCNRLSIGAKSPLTGTIKESNAGGTMAKSMTDHGIKMIIFENQPATDDWRILHIDAEGNAVLDDASPIMGMNNYELGDKLRDIYGKNIAIASIGIAGEHLAKAASIQVTEFQTNLPCRAAARGGLGSVMSSKKLKAVVIEKATNPYKINLTPEQDKEFRQLNKKICAAITANPVTGTTMPKYGSAAGVDVTGKMGAMPWKNFNGKFCPTWTELDSQHWYQRLTGQGGRGGIPCQAGCIVKCSNQYIDKYGNYLSAGIEYETIGLCGSNIGIFDPDVIVSIDRMCDDMGLDTIEIGAAIGVAMDEGILEFGDAEGALNMVRTIFDPCSELGPVLMHGCASMGDKLNAKRVPVSKHQAFAAYDPRVIKGYGLTFERSPMGADHTTGAAMTYRKELTPLQQADVAQSHICTCDCFMCLFPWSAVDYNPEARVAICRMAGILAGEAEGPGAELIDQLGMYILNMEHLFNEREGFTGKDDRLGAFMYVEPAEATNAPYISPFDYNKV